MSYLRKIWIWSTLLSRLNWSQIITTPLEPNTKFTIMDDTLLKDVTFWCQLVESLVYFMVTCLDIAYVVHIVSQFMTAPWSMHFVAVLVSFVMLRALSFIGCIILYLHPSNCRLNQMLIRSVILLIDASPLDFVFSWHISHFLV